MITILYIIGGILTIGLLSLGITLLYVKFKYNLNPGFITLGSKYITKIYQYNADGKKILARTKEWAIVRHEIEPFELVIIDRDLINKECHIHTWDCADKKTWIFEGELHHKYHAFWERDNVMKLSLHDYEDQKQDCRHEDIYSKWRFDSPYKRVNGHFTDVIHREFLRMKYFHKKGPSKRSHSII